MKILAVRIGDKYGPEYETYLERKLPFEFIWVREPIEDLLLSNVMRPAVAGLSKSLSKSLGSENILVNVVCPGTILTNRLISGKQKGLGECIGIEGSSVPCKSETDIKLQNFSGKDTRNISIVSKKWGRISQYESNTKKGKIIGMTETN